MEYRWREMIEYLNGGRIPRSKYPRTTLDQFTLKDDILYLCKRKVDGREGERGEKEGKERRMDGWGEREGKG